MTTSYDRRNSLALQYLSAMFGVEFRIADDIRRNPCTRCNETGNFTTARVYGDSNSRTHDMVECCVICLNGAITSAVDNLRSSNAKAFVEVAARLTVVVGDFIEVHDGTKCMRSRGWLDTSRRYVVEDRTAGGFLIVRAEGTLTPTFAIRFANVALICTGVPSV